MHISASRGFQLAFFSILGTLYAIPLLRPDRPYIDDLGRRLNGYLNWSAAGRPLSDLVMAILNVGVPISDLAPLPQILAVSIVSLCSYLLFRWTDGMKLPGLMRAAAAAFFLFNPFLLQNLSYRFDSLPMSLAMLSALLALNPGVRSGRMALAAGVALVWAALALYQAALNVALAGAVLLVIADVDAGHGESALKNFARRIVSAMLGYALYWATISNWMPLNGYATPHSSPVPVSKEGIGLLLGHSVQALRYVIGSFDRIQQTALAIPLVTGAIVCLVLAAQVWRTPLIRLRFLLVPLIAVSPVLMLLLAFGASIALDDPVYSARVFMAFGCTEVFFILLALRGLTALKYRKLALATGVLFLAPVAIFSIITPYAFSIAQVAQQSFDQHLARRLEAGLRSIDAPQPIDIAIDGKQPFAKVVLRQAQRFPVIAKLVPLYLQNSNWATYYLRNEDMEARWARGAPGDEAVAKARVLPADYVDEDFTLTKINDIVVIRFRT